MLVLLAFSDTAGPSWPSEWGLLIVRLSYRLYTIGMRSKSAGGEAGSAAEANEFTLPSTLLESVAAWLMVCGIRI
jgi:hypothetical protein